MKKIKKGLIHILLLSCLLFILLPNTLCTQPREIVDWIIVTH